MVAGGSTCRLDQRDFRAARSIKLSAVANRSPFFLFSPFCTAFLHYGESREARKYPFLWARRRNNFRTLTLFSFPFSAILFFIVEGRSTAADQPSQK
jgi:hypothetical protein